MTLPLLLALALLPGLPQAPAAPPPQDDDPPAARPVVQEPTRRPLRWQIAFRVATPMTTTDPQHVSTGVGLAYTGAYRTAFQYQPTEHGQLGMIRASAGFRLVKRQAWHLVFDLEHSQARPSRRLFRGTGWQLEGHERHQLSIAAVTLQAQERRWLGLVDSVEVGAGEMHLWRMVSARADGAPLSPSRDPILESAAPVGIIGVRASRPLFLGLNGSAHLRLIGAGRSRGGEVPFAHMTAEWDVMRQLFRSPRFGRGVLGLSGHHATSSRAVSYFQHGLGLTFRLDF